ncbi:MAG: hypothetical protein ACOX6T_19430 [Myxococcales bacterium]|jgi:hypothetical protein
MPRVTLSRQVLELVPFRAFSFLMGVGTNPGIRAAMDEAGYSEADHAEGWLLPHDAAGFRAGRAGPRGDEPSGP